MEVRVDQSRHQQMSGAFDDPGIMRSVDTVTDGGDALPLHQNIRRGSGLLPESSEKILTFLKSVLM